MLKNSLVPKIRIHTLRRFLFFAVVAVGIFSAGYLLGNSEYTVQLEKITKVTINREPPPDKQDLEFSLFWRVWDKPMLVW